jgi:hypothetical protein
MTAAVTLTVNTASLCIFDSVPLERDFTDCIIDSGGLL